MIRILLSINSKFRAIFYYLMLKIIAVILIMKLTFGINLVYFLFKFNYLIDIL